MIRVTIFDYGAGNLHSLAKALAAPDVALRIAIDPLAALETDVLILPGVGAFTGAATRIKPARDAVRRALEQGLPCLAICLGLQLLFDASEEGPGEGLGLIRGRVERLRAPLVPLVPHMGWNTLHDVTDPLLAESPLPSVYFAHSYVCRPGRDDVVTAWTTVGGDRFPAVVRHGRTLGVQFHPEKSSAAGVSFLRAFLQRAPGGLCDTSHDPMPPLRSDPSGAVGGGSP